MGVGNVLLAKSVADAYYRNLKMNRDQSVYLSVAVRSWWESHRPIGWTELQHRQNPSINTISPAEENLAIEFVRLSKYRMSTVERFWNKVDKEGPIHPYNPILGMCWMWKGAASGNCAKYGNFGIGGRHGGAILAHQFSWVLFGGILPRLHERKDRCLRHSCDRGLCVNPSHLSVGTQKQNVRDTIEHGRFRGMGYIYKSRTNCSNGHDFTPENTGRRKDSNARVCKTCLKERRKI